MSKKLTQEEFINKAKEIHGDRYGYQDTAYTGRRNTIQVYCNTHKKYFPIQAGNFLNGSGCRDCYLDSKKDTLESFIAKAKKIHQDKYDYSYVRYKGSKSYVRILCTTCGTMIRQKPNDHLSGYGCKTCADNANRSSKEHFIKLAQEVHGDKYSYDNYTYINVTTPSWITCPLHGDFKQDCVHHVYKGQGCPDCVERHTGFNLTYFKENCIKNNDGLGIFYLLRCTKDDEVFYKYGITSKSVKDRYRTKSSMPYNYTIEYTIEDIPEVIFELEKYIKYRDDTLVRYIPSIEFEGYTECCVSLEPKYIQNTYNNIKRDVI